MSSTKKPSPRVVLWCSGPAFSSEGASSWLVQRDGVRSSLYLVWTESLILDDDR